MREFDAGSYDVAVIGAGHAGIEAALAAARLGCETAVFTINLDSVGNMPCNPAIGGTGKGHLVRELDALGGEMAKAADECCIQYRLLNLRKGPAVWSLRAQADRRKYQERMKRTLERQSHLTVRQGQVVEVRTDRGAVSQVVLATGAVYDVKAAILATGTYLKGRTIIGNCVEDSGPDGLHAAGPLTDSLLKLGLPLRRFKTGTPPRVNARTVDFDEMEVQPGDELPVPFSYSTKNPPYNQAVCWLTWTTEETKRIVQENLDRAPMYSGLIEGIGPRYCPSFETKIVRFPDKLRHQLFVEPMGLNTEELYIQGFSSSLPEEVQIQMLHSVPGLRRAVVWVAALNLAYFGIEFVVALAIGSVSLFADSVDFLEDTAVNLLIFVALGFTLRWRSVMGKVMAVIICVPAVAAAVSLILKAGNPEPPDPLSLTVTAGGAVLVNLACALILARFREHGGSMTTAAFLAARNDVLVNVAIIVMGLITAATLSGWPDIVLGAIIIVLNVSAAKEVWEAAENENLAAQAMAGDFDDD